MTQDATQDPNSGPRTEAPGEGAEGSSGGARYPDNSSGEIHPPGLCREPTCPRCAAIRRAGGAARRKKAPAAWPLDGPPRTIADAERVAAAALEAVWAGQMDHRTAREVSVMANAFIRTVQLGRLAARVAELEQLLAKLSSRNPKE